jgi:hypothetical protein
MLLNRAEISMLEADVPVPKTSEGYLTALTEPCGALPRKCLFIHLFVYWTDTAPSKELHCSSRFLAHKNLLANFASPGLQIVDVLPVR